MQLHIIMYGTLHAEITNIIRYEYYTFTLLLFENDEIEAHSILIFLTTLQERVFHN